MVRPYAPQWLPNPLSNNELVAVLADPEPRWRLVGILGAFAGLRACEICSLDRDDVTVVSLRVLGKGDTVGVVPTHPLIWQQVADRPPGPLVTNVGGGQLSGKKLSAWARHHFDRRQLYEVRLHPGNTCAAWLSRWRSGVPGYRTRPTPSPAPAM